MSSMKKRRDLTDEEKGEAQRLANAWEAFKGENPGATQVWLAAETGLGSQSAVNQYLRGVVPLNLTALLSFCRVLGLDPHKISSRLAGVVGSFGAPSQAQPAQQENGLTVASTAREQLVLLAYRMGNENDRSAMDALAEQILRRANAGPREPDR